MAVIVTFYEKRQDMSNSRSDYTSNQKRQGIKDSVIHDTKYELMLHTHPLGQSNAHLPDVIYDMTW